MGAAFRFLPSSPRDALPLPRASVRAGPVRAPRGRPPGGRCGSSETLIHSCSGTGRSRVGSGWRGPSRRSWTQRSQRSHRGSGLRVHFVWEGGAGWAWGCAVVLNDSPARGPRLGLGLGVSEDAVPGGQECSAKTLVLRDFRKKSFVPNVVWFSSLSWLLAPFMPASPWRASVEPCRMEAACFQSCHRSEGFLDVLKCPESRARRLRSGLGSWPQDRGHGTYS